MNSIKNYIWSEASVFVGTLLIAGIKDKRKFKFT